MKNKRLANRKIFIPPTIFFSNNESIYTSDNFCACKFVHRFHNNEIKSNKN